MDNGIVLSYKRPRTSASQFRPGILDARTTKHLPEKLSSNKTWPKTAEPETYSNS